MIWSGHPSLSERGRKNGGCGPPRAAPTGADARQSSGHGAGRQGRLVLRTQVGRVSGAGLPGRRRRGAAVPQRQGPGPLLPRGHRRGPRRARAALRPGRRDRRAQEDRRQDEVGLGVAEPAHPPRRVADLDVGRTDPGTLHRFRRRRRRRRLAAARPVPGPPGGAAGIRRGETVVSRHPHHRGRRARHPVARGVRRRRARRRHRQTARRRVPARQTGDGEDQAPPRRRLCGHRLPRPQERRRGGIDPARTVPRRRRTADGRRRCLVHRQSPAGAAGRPRAAAHR